MLARYFAASRRVASTLSKSVPELPFTMVSATLRTRPPGWSTRPMARATTTTATAATPTRHHPVTASTATPTVQAAAMASGAYSAVRYHG